MATYIHHLGIALGPGSAQSTESLALPREVGQFNRVLLTSVKEIAGSLFLEGRATPSVSCPARWVPRTRYPLRGKGG